MAIYLDEACRIVTVAYGRPERINMTLYLKNIEIIHTENYSSKGLSRSYNLFCYSDLDVLGLDSQKTCI